MQMLFTLLEFQAVTIYIHLQKKNNNTVMNAG